MTRLNWGRKEGKIRFFITFPKYIWTLLTQEPSPAKVSAQTVTVIESEQRQQQQQQNLYINCLPHYLQRPGFAIEISMLVSSDLEANGEGGTHRHIQWMCWCAHPRKHSRHTPAKERTSCIWGPASQRGELLTAFGLYGGWISLRSSFSQSIYRKNACSLMSRSPSGPQPRRLPGCLVIS